jgi:hypothetical protein
MPASRIAKEIAHSGRPPEDRKCAVIVVDPYGEVILLRSGKSTVFGLPPGLVLRLLLLLHVGGGLAAPVLVVDLDHLFAGRLIAALRLRRWLRSRSFAFAAGHSQTVHRPAASTRKRAQLNCRRDQLPG